MLLVRMMRETCFHLKPTIPFAIECNVCDQLPIYDFLASPLVVLDDTAEIEDDRAPQAALRQQTSKRRRTLDPENADIHSPKRSRSTDAPEAEADEDEVQFIANCPSAIAAVAVANKDDDQNDANDLIMLD